MSERSASPMSQERAEGALSPGARAPIVHVRGLEQTFEQGRIRALDGMDLEVMPGEFVALCGPSGCGKTTLLNILAGIERPQRGEVRVAGFDLSRISDFEADRLRREVVGLIFQLHNLLPSLTALENVQAPLLMHRMSQNERRARALEALRQVDLLARRDALPPSMSGGERQRVAIARAIVHRPRLLLADEPTGALDSRNGDAIFSLLARLQAEHGMTLILVTHDASAARRAHRVVHMLDGRVAGAAGEDN